MSRVRKALRIAVPVLALAAVGAGAYFGLKWYRTVPLERVIVAGNVHADPARIEELAALDTVSFVFDANPEVVAARVKRHPWVRDVDVTRWPTGTLEIEVHERTPVMLALDASGRPRYYIDADGYRMPLVQGAFHNVPLLRGVQSSEGVGEPTKDPRVRALASDLAELGEEELAIASEFDVRGREVWLRTATTLGGQSIEVRLGRGGFGEKMRRLHAFWHQAVLTQPDTHFELVDLRFDSQIVTREAAAGNAGTRSN
ncbi:MAG TPA: FtsQ-type POTRA domain-containing protein [Rhodothermales bacterium]